MKDITYIDRFKNVTIINKSDLKLIKDLKKTEIYEDFMYSYDELDEEVSDAQLSKETTREFNRMYKTENFYQLISDFENIQCKSDESVRECLIRFQKIADYIKSVKK